MNGVLKMLLISPRLTIGLALMLFGGIGGALSSRNDDHAAKKNPWSSSAGESAYTAQKRADDGWGAGTRSTSARDSRGGKTYETVWVDKDGVIHEKEDMKAYDPDAY